MLTRSLPQRLLALVASFFLARRKRPAAVRLPGKKNRR